MDIGQQQRVIIVEPDQAVVPPSQAPLPAELETVDTESAAAWPLPLDLDQEVEPVS